MQLLSKNNLKEALKMNTKQLTKEIIIDKLAHFNCELVAIQTSEESMFKRDVIWFNTSKHSTKVLFFEDFTNFNLLHKAV